MKYNPLFNKKKTLFLRKTIQELALPGQLHHGLAIIRTAEEKLPVLGHDDQGQLEQNLRTLVEEAVHHCTPARQ